MYTSSIQCFSQDFSQLGKNWQAINMEATEGPGTFPSTRIANLKKKKKKVHWVKCLMGSRSPGCYASVNTIYCTANEGTKTKEIAYP